MVVQEHSKIITLKDGRKLAYAEYGDPNGKPIFHFHGTGSSRLEYPPDETVLDGIRYIGTDRPGHGLSDYAPNYKLLDWADDVVQLADSLGIDRFYVLGWSAGGPRALACAYKYPERVIAATLAAGFAPPDRPNALEGLPLPNRILIWSGRKMPWLASLQFRLMGRMLGGDTQKATELLLSSAPDVDKSILERPEVTAMLIASIQEGYQNWEGPFQDGMLQVNSWGFDIAEIQIRVDIWQGDADVNVPFSSAEYMRDTLPNTRMNVLPNKGHFFVFDHWREMIQALVSEN